MKGEINNNIPYSTAGFICEVLIFAKFARGLQACNFNSVATLLPPAHSYLSSYSHMNQQQGMLY